MSVFDFPPPRVDARRVDASRVDAQREDSWPDDLRRDDGRSIDEIAADLDQTAERATAVAERIAQLTVSATTSQGAIEVNVDSAGICTRLQLEPEVMRWSSDELADEIMQAMRRGHELMRDKVNAVVREIMGNDSVLGQAVLAGFDARVDRATGGADAGTQRNISGW